MEKTEIRDRYGTEEELLKERYDLAWERIGQIPEEHFGAPAFERYFAAMAERLLFLRKVMENPEMYGAGDSYGKRSAQELAAANRELYAPILPENYETGYCNPAYAVKELGEELGPPLCVLSAGIFEQVYHIFDGLTDRVLVCMELFVEIYAAFTYQWQEDGTLPDRETVRRILYWAVCDYAEEDALLQVKKRTCPEETIALRILKNCDLSDPRYLYAYGEYVTENELETARFLAALDDADIAAMADAYTEGFRMGFEVMNKDLTKKNSVMVIYRLGFERVIRRAVENFEKMGLRPVIHRRTGFEGAKPNRQFSYDHRFDQALWLDKNYVNRRMEALRAAYEQYREEAGNCAGPAVMETFGEKVFEPVMKPEALRLGEEQNRLQTELVSRAGEMENEYSPEEETSYTIIAFPVPEIGPVFRELFWETLRINTLDYALYRDVQQKIIDVLDTADHCKIKGMGENRTDLKVNLWKLSDPEKETIFENCVADVNIPVGEVFTSPVLEGTNGVLHVTRVFLNGLEYRDLFLTFQDGMIRDYGCGNYEDPEEGRRFIRENVLHRHDTLPMGEFAIGTNTTAYMTAKRLGVEAKFPILIAEKTGPHFAVGDTCYSHEEDTMTYNPDGKAIVARENAVSALRREKPLEAYYNCHTDITIPYDELGELAAVLKDGTCVPIIQKGRFVLPGTEPLNEALGSLK